MKFVLSVLSVLVAVGLGGCSITLSGEDGTTRIIGFVDLEIRSQDESATFAGYVADVTTVGVAVLSTPEASGISLGYNHQQIGILRNNVLVVGDAFALGNQPPE